MLSSLKKPHGEWLVLAAAVLWGTTGTSQALAPEGATPLAIGALRLMIGGGGLLIAATASGSFTRRQPWPRWITLLTAASIAGYQVLFFAGVATTGVAIGTIVGIGSAPVLAGALGWLLFRERPGSRWLIATALAILGCGLLALSSGQLNFNPSGILFALGAGTCYAFYAHLSKRLIRLLPPDAVMAVIFCMGAILLSPALVIVDLSWLGTLRGMAVALHLGLVTTTVANLFFGRGLSIVPTAHAVTLSLAEPLTAGLLGVFLLGETLTPLAWIGILLIFGGLILLSR